MNTAIIVAAGSGERFKSEIPKQFLEIKGKPVMVHTIERFQAVPSVDSIILVLADDRVESFQSCAERFSKISQIVPGGRTRAESVWNGLRAVDERCHIVAVHDGARPLVSVDEVERTIAKAEETGAACLVARVTDTVKSIRGNEIAATLDRDKLRRALTPQAFKTEVLKRAFELADLNDAVTDECCLVEKLGYPIEVVEGGSYNIKITHQEDLILAEALIDSIV